MKEGIKQADREILLSAWCSENGIRRFLFDLDDTLCPTRWLIKRIALQAYDYLATNAPINSHDKWMAEIEAANNRLFESLGVNQNRWNLVMDELADRYDLGKNVTDETKRIFQQIYTTPIFLPKIVDEGLSIIKGAKIPIGVVTHASVEWTKRKYDWLGLSKFLQWNEVFVVDENRHKTSKSWSEAINKFGIKASECVVVGDSPRSDINPAREAGVIHCILFEDPFQWSIHNQPIHPSTKKIKRIDQIAEVLLENR